MVRQLGLQSVQQIAIDLSVVAADQEYNLSGNYFYVKEAPDQDMYVEVKINGSNNKAIPWSKQMGFIHPFNRLYITTPAGQAGTMTILIASEAPELFDVVDNRSAISETLVDVLDELKIISGELQGDTTPENFAVKTLGTTPEIIIPANANRKSCLATVIVPIVYIGFDNTVSPTKFLQLLDVLGKWCYLEDYRGDVWGIGSVAGRSITWAEW